MLRHERQHADADSARVLGIGCGDEIVYLERLRSAGSRPLAILTNVLPVAVAGEITSAQLRRSGLYHLLRAAGTRPRVAEQVIGARGASPQQAATLGLEIGAALLTMRRVTHDDLGRTVELGAQVYDAATYAVEMTVVDG